MGATAPKTPAWAPTEGLDDLARLTSRELGKRYAAGRLPELSALDGDPMGRMLAVRGLSRTDVGARLRAWAASPGFVWAGKSFAATGPASGRGINRVRLLGRQLLFPFHTFIGPSRLDGRPAVILNYDLPDNPGAIRRIHDEVREVAPGLFLGPAMWKTARGAALVLWFALDTHTPDRPVEW